MRIEIKFGVVFPHIQIVNLAFLDNPYIDFALKPVGYYLSVNARGW
jgi:Ca2+-dependent lipid-binding protein